MIMEYLSLGAKSDQKALGRALAKMHLAEPTCQEAKEGKFGFPVDNTIGGTSMYLHICAYLCKICMYV